jgi:hypothetical protein
VDRHRKIDGSLAATCHQPTTTYVIILLFNNLINGLMSIKIKLKYFETNKKTLGKKLEKTFYYKKKLTKKTLKKNGKNLY